PDIGAVEGVSPTPAGYAAVANVTSSGGTTYQFTVAYHAASPALINFGTVDSQDVRVTGPGGFNVLATLVGATPGGNASPVTATYSFVPPGGAWDPADFGTYTVAMEPNQVFDTAPTPLAVPAGTLATFQVSIAQTITVTTTADTGPGSLRQAILTSNSTPGATDTIVFGLPSGAQAIDLLTAAPAISDSVTISNATGAANLTVRRSASAPANFGIFSVTAAAANVTLEGFTITGGTAGSGGGITASTKNLTVRDMVITGNTGTTGGAIFVPSGATGLLRVENSTISGNTGGTGGIYFYSGGNLLVRNSTISGNTGTSGSGWHGGGMVFYGPVGSTGVTVENSTFHGNKTANGFAGGGG
ncbi:MAG: right-handed parallel beta-helix repeat-containing protein, partial [Actinobacteria bacterium]|nr:right-handed parallel beta-helix repeat-containing protein [Actinomycetota bacterium]